MESISRTFSAIPSKLAAAYQWCSAFVFGRTVASVKPATHLNNIESCQIDASARKRKAESTEFAVQPPFKHGRVETFSYSNDDKDEPGQSLPDKMEQSQSSKPEISQNTNTDEVIVIDDSKDEPGQSPDKMGQNQSSKPEVSQNTNTDEVIVIDDSDDEPGQSPDKMGQNQPSKPGVSQNTNTDEVIVIDDSDDESTDSATNKTRLSLSTNQWLGDEHLSVFAGLIKDNFTSGNKDHFIFDPLFFTKLSEKHCKGLELDDFINNRRKAIKKSACLDYSNIHIPIRVTKSHWILITVNRDEKKITVFDSWYKNSESYSHLIESLKGFFKSFDLDINTECFDGDLKQYDAWNCGVAVLTRLAANTLLDKPYHFKGCSSDFLGGMRQKINEVFANDSVDCGKLFSYMQSEI